MELPPRARSVVIPNRAIPSRLAGLALERSSLMTSRDFIAGDRLPIRGELPDSRGDLPLVYPSEPAVLRDRLAAHDDAADGFGLHGIDHLLGGGHRRLHRQRI